jgi:hypothetical protein
METTPNVATIGSVTREVISAVLDHLDACATGEEFAATLDERLAQFSGSDIVDAASHLQSLNRELWINFGKRVQQELDATAKVDQPPGEPTNTGEDLPDEEVQP